MIAVDGWCGGLPVGVCVGGLTRRVATDLMTRGGGRHNFKGKRKGQKPGNLPAPGSRVSPASSPGRLGLGGGDP